MSCPLRIADVAPYECGPILLSVTHVQRKGPEVRNFAQYSSVISATWQKHSSITAAIKVPHLWRGRDVASAALGQLPQCAKVEMKCILTAELKADD